jgi:hypothetical protein
VYDAAVRTARTLPAVLLLLLLPALAGCVERRFAVHSSPEGARVLINGRPEGVTPLVLPFTHYGTVRVEAEPYDEDGDGLPEYRGLVVHHGLSAPWYQWFPVDFFSDNLWPWTLLDSHEVVLVLEPTQKPDSEREIEAMKAEVGPLKDRAGRARAEAEAEAEDRPPPPGGGGK